jgi:hypothetical protein
MGVYNHDMAKDAIHISEAEVASKFALLMASGRVRKSPAEPARRTISESIALLPVDSTTTIDPYFAKEVEAAIESHREPLNPPAWA